MGAAVLGKKMRRNVARRTDLRKPVSRAAVMENIALGVGRTVTTLLQWTLGIGFVVVVSFGILMAYRWVTSHDFFALRALEIHGGQRLDQSEIASLGGVAVGSNVLDVNIAEVQRRIGGNEWVESVSVTRVLPDRIIIEVTEREPAFLAARDQHIYYADKYGHPIAAVGVDKFISLPVLDREDGVPVAEGVHRLLDEISRNALPFGMSQIAWLRQDSAEQFSLYLEKPRILVQLDGTDLEATLACLAKLWNDLDGRGELGSVASMFVMPGRAWIRLDTDQKL